MSIKNPFENIGGHKLGERFVGRKEKVEQIQHYCTSQNFSIVGMPRIGKTSLAYHSVIANKEKVYSEKPLCTIFFNVGNYSNNKAFFKYLVMNTYEALSEIIHEEKEEKMLNRFYSRRKDDDFELCTIADFFKHLCALNVNVVIIFDEFDKVRDIGFTNNDFSILRDILQHIHGITVSKRSIEVLERGDKGNPGSNFFQLFQGSPTISLKGFDNESLNEYWERLTPYFKEKNIEIDNHYKEKAEFYVGNHPHLLDVYNSTIYYAPINPDTKVRDEMRKACDYVMKILQESELLNTAIQAILGPLYNIKLEDIDQLVSYDFLKKVTISQKEELLGESSGYVAEDENSNKYSYIAFSDYFTLLMRNKFINNFDFWQEWTDTLLALRKLIEKFLKDNWGEEWEKNANLDEDLKDKLYDFREKDIRANITPSPLIAYLTESLIYNLISKYWDSTFERVFTPWNSNDFNTRISFILKIRNHYAHINAGSFSNTDISQTNLYLKETLDKLTNWFEKNENLKIKIVPTPVIIRGEVIKNHAGKKQIKGDNGKFYSDMRSNLTLSIGDYVEFEIGKEADKFNHDKPHYYAKNIKLIK